MIKFEVCEDNLHKSWPQAFLTSSDIHGTQCQWSQYSINIYTTSTVSGIKTIQGKMPTRILVKDCEAIQCREQSLHKVRTFLIICGKQATQDGAAFECYFCHVR